MKNNKSTLIAIAAAALLSVVWLANAQPRNAVQKYEVAMIKWDGGDKLQFITPEKSEMIRLFKTGVDLPRDIRDEEFCLTWAANKLAQEGWEPVNLDSSRILMRRQIQ